MTDSEVVRQLCAELERAAAELPVSAPMAMDFDLPKPMEDDE